MAKARARISSSRGALIVLLGLGATPALAADLVIWREVPTQNAIEPLNNQGPAIGVPTEDAELVQSLVPGAKLSDDQFGAVLASPPPDAPVNSQIEGLTQSIDGSRGDALSNLPGSGLNSFSSLGGLGGQVSGQVNDAVGHALQGLGMITPGTSGQ